MNQQGPIDEHLLLQYLLGKSTPDEQHEIEGWLSADPEHRRELERLEWVWLQSGRLAPPPVAVDPEAAWQKVSQRIALLEEEVTSGVGRGRIFRLNVLRISVAAAAMIVLLLSFWWFFVRTVPEPLQVVVSADAVVTDTLGDGTVVVLNTGSSLSRPEIFTGGIREVSLDGEAFFRVMRDTLRPFIVLTADAGIRVLGTAFNVKAYPGQPLVVFVSEGRVELFAIDPLTGDTASVCLSAGMRGVLSPGSVHPAIDPQTPPDELFWMDHTLHFRDVPLSEVIATLNRCFGLTIRTSDPSIAGCRLTASFSGEPAEIILQIIADTFSLTLVQENGEYIFDGHGCTTSNR